MTETTIRIVTVGRWELRLQRPWAYTPSHWWGSYRWPLSNLNAWVVLGYLEIIKWNCDRCRNGYSCAEHELRQKIMLNSYNGKV